MPSKTLLDLDERTLFALLDMYESAIAEIDEPHDARVAFARDRLMTRRVEVISALADLQHVRESDDDVRDC
jgi:hypothetical protein